MSGWIEHSIDGNYCLACKFDEGWLPFGTHADREDLVTELEFSGEDEDGLPIFERVIK